MAVQNSAWGIDVGNRALKAIRLQRTADGVQIANVEVIEHEHVLSQAGDNRESLIQAALANFVQRHGVKEGGVAVGVSGQASFARFIKLPPVEPKKIPEIVRFEAIQQIPFPLQDVEWSYQLFQDEQSPDVEVGIFAMRKELVNRQLQYFTDTGLKVELVQMNPLAVYNAMYHDKRIKGTTMIIDLGAENTDLIIAEGETIWLRSIPIGGNNFTEALVKAFKLKFAKAEDLKRNAATSKYGRQILQAMRPIFSDLVAEIQRSIGFYASVHRDSRISRVLALGGTFRLPGLQKYLQQNLQLEVSRIDRLGNGGPDDARVAAAFNDNLLSSVSAYGLALQALGEAKISSSLLPETIRRERMWQEKTKWFAAAAALVVVGTGIAFGQYFVLQARNDADQKAYAQEITTVLKDASGFDTQWKAIAASGGADRGQIAAFNGVLSGRDIWEGLLTDVVSAFPAPPSSAEDLAKFAAIKRGQRELVTLLDWQTYYQPDMGPALAMTPEQFAGLAGMSGAVDQPTIAPKTGGRGPTRRRIERTPVRTGGKGNHAPTGHSVQLPTAPRAVAPVVSAGPKIRGFLITLHCTTPNSAGSSYVRDSVVAALREMGEKSAKAGTPHSYQIDKVEVVSVSRVGDDFAGSSPPPPPRSGAAGTPAVIDPLADPLFPAESRKDDTAVTLLIGVRLDPVAPAAAPDGAPSTPGAKPPVAINSTADEQVKP